MLPGLDGAGSAAGAWPGLFGETKMLEVTPVLAEFFGLARGDFQAWVQPPGLLASQLVFVRGKPAALQSMNRQMAWSDPQAYSYSTVTLTADVTLTRALPGTPQEQAEVVWRGRVPVRGGQSSLLKNLVWPDAGEDAKPWDGAWDLKIEALPTGAAPAANPTDPAKPDSWNLAISGSLRPPLVDAASGLAYQTNDGTPQGATLRKTVGKTGQGQEVILTVRLTPDAPLKASGAAVALRRVGSGNVAWWWHQQVANAGDE